MVELIHAEGAAASINAYDYLIATQGTNAFGSGISAMPSLHVGIAVLEALFVRQRFPKFQWVAWAFVGITYVGSIHLGWHYATDGILSAFFVVLIWIVMRAYVAWLAGIFRQPGNAHLAA
jgi:hypothetical protein